MSGPLYLERFLHGTVTVAVSTAADPPGEGDGVLALGDVGVGGPGRVAR